MKYPLDVMPKERIMADKTGTVLAWHFVGDTLRDGRPIPPDGEWLEHHGPLEICESGYHGSERALDALQYAPGNTICRVEMGGEILHKEDKLDAMRRRILWRVDGEQAVRAFARWCALRVIGNWKASSVVAEWLTMGDEELRLVARDAAWDAARDAAWDEA